MDYFKYDPLIVKPFESGKIDKDKIEAMLLNFPWEEMIKKQNEAENKNIKCSPGISIINEEGKEIFVSIVGNTSEYEFYISYKRPTIIKRRKWFKVVEFLDENYNSIIPQQTLQNGIEASLWLFDKNFDALEKKYG